MHVISIISRKGGVGKSTIASTIAAGLAIKGYRVGLVDASVQGHAAVLLGMPKENGLFDAMVDSVELSEIVRLVPAEYYVPEGREDFGELYLLPSSTKTARIPLEADDPYVFIDVMHNMERAYELDIAVIDTAPETSMLDSGIWTATDLFLFVTTVEALSFDGLQTGVAQVKRYSDRRERFNLPPSRVIGILPNMVRAKPKVHREQIAALKRTYGELVWAPIMLRAAITEASSHRLSVFAFSPDGGEAKDLWNVVDRTEEAIQVWLKSVGT